MSRRVLMALGVWLIAVGISGWLAASMSPVAGAAPAHRAMLDQGSGNDDPACDDDHSGPGGGSDCPGEDNSGPGKGGAGDAPAAPGAAPVAADGAATVHIVGRSFSPSSITIAAGQAVTFINDDGDTHTATGSGFDTGTIAPGGSVTVVPSGAGSLAYQCAIHPEMAGTVVVTGAAGATAAAPGAEPSPVVPAPPPPAPGVATVEIADFKFTPTQLTVTAGTEVVWTNAGRSPHTVSGDFGDSGTLTTDQSFRFTFAEEGTFDYLCQFHPNMVGSVVVRGDAARDAAAPPSSSPPGASLVGFLTLVIALLTMVRDLLQP